MAHKVEGNPMAGFRVVDDKVGALTGRKKTEADALAAAGLDKPRARTSRAKKDDSES